MVASPLWGRNKMLDEQRHLYSGCYYEKYHIVSSLCSHSMYQCRRNTRSRHPEWLVKQLPLQIAASSIFLQIIPINKGSLCMSSTKSDISVYFFFNKCFKDFRHLPKKTSETFQMESTWVSLGKINWPPFKRPCRIDYLGEFTTAYDLALSPVE